MDDVLEKQKIDHEDSTSQKRIVLRLRWGTIIITSFLLIFARDHTFPEPASSLLVLTYLFSNVIASCLPPYYFVRFSFLCIVLLFDTLMITLGIYLSSRFNTDFYLVYFLIILFASIGRSFRLLMINASVICVIYGWILWTTGWDLASPQEGTLLRIPFIFVTSLFYGFLVQSSEEKTKRMKEEMEEQTRTIVHLKDVAEKKQMEERLIQSERLRALGEMAAGIAHDFNNVLGAILGRAQLIKMEMMTRKTTAASISEEAIKKDLEVIERAATDGAHTVRKILDFTRSKSDESLFFPLDVNEVVDGAIDLARTKIKDEAQATGIQIEVQTIRNQVRPVMGNPSELREVLLNLIFNAIDAMPKGGTILFKTGMENGSVLIEVKDSGIGMSESDRSRIFDPFFTTKGSQRSGLGLCVSYAIIQHHHGEIRAESQQGAGTTFLIRLPVAKS